MCVFCSFFVFMQKCESTPRGGGRGGGGGGVVMQKKEFPDFRFSELGISEFGF